MLKHILFVCQSCHHSSEEQSEHQPADGAQLLAQLHTLSDKLFPSEEFAIHPAGCLWTCDKPCAFPFSAPDKPTYLFTTLPTHETALALLQFGKLYLDSTTGDIPWKQFPEALQSANIAKIRNCIKAATLSPNRIKSLGFNASKRSTLAFRTA
jgi:predicted metal-binding protein